MNTGVKSPDLPIIRASADEIESLFSMFAIQQELEEAEKRMAKRLKVIPHGLRDLRMIKAVIDKLCVRVIETLPYEKRAAVSANARHMAYDVHFNYYGNLPGKDSNWALVNGKDLETLMTHVHEHFCFGCGEGKCRSCDIGKAFDHIKVQSRRKDESWEFIDMSANHAAGEVVEE